jgi:hypothetical protein
MWHAIFAARDFGCSTEDDDFFIHHDAAFHFAYRFDRCVRPVGPFASCDTQESHRGITVTVDGDSLQLRRLTITASKMFPVVEAQFETSQMHDLSDSDVIQMLTKLLINRGRPSNPALASCSAIKFTLLGGEGEERVFAMFAEELQNHFEVRLGWHDMVHGPHFVASIGAARYHRIRQLRRQGLRNELYTEGF